MGRGGGMGGGVLVNDDFDDAWGVGGLKMRKTWWCDTLTLPYLKAPSNRMIEYPMYSALMSQMGVVGELLK